VKNKMPIGPPRKTATCRARVDRGSPEWESTDEGRRMKLLARIGVALVITAGAAARAGADQGAVTGALPGLATFNAPPSWLPFVALAVFASLVVFLVLRLTGARHAAFATPIPLPAESGLRRAQRNVANGPRDRDVRGPA
jgi:hypothetical protein